MNEEQQNSQNQNSDRVDDSQEIPAKNSGKTILLGVLSAALVIAGLLTPIGHILFGLSLVGLGIVSTVMAFKSHSADKANRESAIAERQASIERARERQQELELAKTNALAKQQEAELARANTPSEQAQQQPVQKEAPAQQNTVPDQKTQPAVNSDAKPVENTQAPANTQVPVKECADKPEINLNISNNTGDTTVTHPTINTAVSATDNTKINVNPDANTTQKTEKKPEDWVTKSKSNATSTVMSPT